MHEIEVTKLNKYFGRRQVLKDLNFTIKKGAFLSIFGPNGAGKTTLVKILSTLERPTDGIVKISGSTLGDDATDIRKKIGLISHSPLLCLDLNAYENLEFYGTLYGVDDLKARAEHLLDQVELGHRRYDLVRTFSKGMQQRLAIARALLHKPSIIFLDEPYSGLDPHAVDILDSLIASIRQAHTFIMVSHNLDKGLELCDTAMIVKGGRMIFFQDKKDIDLDGFKDIYRQAVSGGA